MKAYLTHGLAGALLMGLAGTASAQSTLAPHTFEVVRTVGKVNIRDATSEKLGPAKAGNVYDMGNPQPVDPAARLPVKETGKESPDITGFKALAKEGDVTIQAPKAAKAVKAANFTDLKLDTPYKLGSTVKTGRNAFVDLELSPKNQVRVLAKSEIQMGVKMKHPLIIALKLNRGKVDCKLDNFPKGHLFQVQTPVGICGAVGTAYSVEELLGDHSTATNIFVSDGSVYLDGQYVRTIDTPLGPGQSLSISIVERDRERLVTVTFNGQSGEAITLLLWGREFTFTVPAEADQVTGTVSLVVLRMSSDSLDVPSEIRVNEEPVLPLRINDEPESPAGL